MAFFIFFLPVLMVWIVGGFLVLGKEALQGAKLETASRVFRIAAGGSETALKSLSYYSNIPMAGQLYANQRENAEIFKKLAKIGQEGTEVLKLSAQLATKILGNQTYNPQVYTEPIATILDQIYTDASFLESDISGKKGTAALLAERLFSEQGFSSLREKILYFRQIALQAPILLGEEGQATYLILFENNMELRPTGGFIGSFGLFTFDGGIISNLNVQDVYAADGQLRGFVEPPEPIRLYLGEASWFLRDSNWDPDFTVSAARAEWFLDKELDQSVDGVVSIDLEAMKLILEELGPVILQEYNTEINHQNLYEKTQTEVESDFFPGSYKKTNFLSSLSRAILGEITGLNESEYYRFAKALFVGMEKRHVQFFLHNSQAQRAVSQLGYDGGVYIPTCAGNCYPDWFGLAEANVGVNKANSFISRELNYSIIVGPSTITKKLEVVYKNKAGAALGLNGRYKVYTRVLVPLDSKVEKVETRVGLENGISLFDEENIHGRKEIGALIEIFPGEEKSLIFSWSDDVAVDFSKSGEYRLYVRKQAGTLSDAIDVRVGLPEGFMAIGSEALSLTADGSYVYNTALARDLFSRLYW
jgi:hypothetical protein